ncbi:hypothetical protein GIX45_25510 [Erwinia sp. CPCC 100877]|nr:hypothetical protein [Erwinia sp. CPCC 100877]
MVEFTTSVTKEDWITFNKIYVKYTHRKGFRLILVVMILAFLIFLGSLHSLVDYLQRHQAYFESFGYGELFSVATFTVMMPIIYFILTALLAYRYFFSIPLAARRMVEHPENSKMLFKRKVLFDDAFIQVLVDKDESKYAWESLTKIIETSEYLALFLNERSCLLFSKSAVGATTISELNKMLDKYCSAKLIRL